VQENSSEGVNEEGARHKGRFGSPDVGRFSEFRNGPELRDELPVGRTNGGEIPQRTEIGGERLLVELRGVLRVADDDLGAKMEAVEDLCECGGISTRADVGALAEETIALPLEFVANLSALLIGQTAGDNQSPRSIPRKLRRRVDLLVGVFETKPASGREGVEAAPSVTMRFKPTVPHEAKDAGANQSFGDAEGGEEIDQLPEPDRSTVRCDGVSEDSKDKGFGPRTFYFDEALDRPVDSLCCAHRLGGSIDEVFNMTQQIANSE
jgi:hypothetical protein